MLLLLSSGSIRYATDFHRVFYISCSCVSSWWLVSCFMNSRKHACSSSTTHVSLTWSCLENMVDRWSLLGFSSTPYLFSSSRKCYGFFLSFSTLSAFFSLQYFLEISYFISSDRSSVGNCNCSWHCLNNFLDAGSFSQIDQKLFLFQIQSLLLFQNNVIQYIWHLKWRLFIVLIHDNGAWKSWKQLPFV